MADDFAGQLRALKDRSGLSYGVLAKRLHMSTSTLHRYCNGTAVPAEYAPVERFARVCRATPAELVELHRHWILADAGRGRKGEPGAPGPAAQDATLAAGAAPTPARDATPGGGAGGAGGAVPGDGSGGTAGAVPGSGSGGPAGTVPGDGSGGSAGAVPGGGSGGSAGAAPGDGSGGAGGAVPGDGPGGPAGTVPGDGSAGPAGAVPGGGPGSPAGAAQGGGSGGPAETVPRGGPGGSARAGSGGEPGGSAGSAAAGTGASGVGPVAGGEVPGEPVVTDAGGTRTRTRTRTGTAPAPRTPRTPRARTVAVAAVTAAAVIAAVVLAVNLSGSGDGDRGERSGPQPAGATATDGPASPSASVPASASASRSGKPGREPSASDAAPPSTRATGRNRPGGAAGGSGGGTLLNVATRPYVYDSPCSQHFLVNSRPEQVGPPAPTEQDAPRWAAAYGAVSADDQEVALTLQGTGSDTVVLEKMHVRVLGKAAPLAWNDYSMGVGCGGNVFTKSFDVDLDSGSPTVTAKNGQRDFPYKVSESDPEVFYVTAHTKAHDVRWDLTVEWSSGTRRGTAHIDNNGTPFRTSAATGRPGYDYPLGGSEWIEREEQTG